MLSAQTTQAPKAAKAPATDAAPIEETVVTGQRQSIESAMELKRALDTVADSIVLDEAGKVPSTSLLEILERARRHHESCSCWQRRLTGWLCV